VCSLWFVIQSLPTRQAKVGKLLDIIPTRGAKAFPELIRALVSTQQEHLAKILDPALTQDFTDSGGDGHEERMDIDLAAAAAATAEKSVGEKVAEIRMFFVVIVFSLIPCHI